MPLAYLEIDGQRAGIRKSAPVLVEHDDSVWKHCAGPLDLLRRLANEPLGEPNSAPRTLRRFGLPSPGLTAKVMTNMSGSVRS